jgi:hypothetical protein
LKNRFVVADSPIPRLAPVSKIIFRSPQVLLAVQGDHTAEGECYHIGVAGICFYDLRIQLSSLQQDAKIVETDPCNTDVITLTLCSVVPLESKQDLKNALDKILR